MPNRDYPNRPPDWDWDDNSDTGDRFDARYNPAYSARGYYTPYYYNRGYYANPGYMWGQYTGYGPTNQHRSDDRIWEDINDRLTWHSRLDATDIRVEVNNGVATLSGSVDSRRDKRLAEDIADSVSGVWDVNNQLHVRDKGGKHRMPGRSANEIRDGMEVLGSDGRPVGSVKEVHYNAFLVDRRDAPDVFVPIVDCHMSDGVVRLQVASADVDKQGWETTQGAGTR
jgi:hypothetical protein